MKVLGKFSSTFTLWGMMPSNNHHLWWPRTRYRSGVAKQFRELRCQQVELDVEAHKLLHVMSTPPERPAIKDMRAAIERHREKRCVCFKDLHHKVY